MEWAGPTPTHVWWIKTWEGYLGSEGSHPHTRRPPTEGPSARKVSPQNFCLKKPAGIEPMEEISGAPNSSS